jgi:hypothetical protein
MRKRHLPADAEQEVVAQGKRHPQQELAIDVVVVVAHEERQPRQDHEGANPNRPPDKG